MRVKSKLIVRFWLVLILCGLMCYSVNPAQAEEWQTLVNDTRLTSSGATNDYYPSLGVDGLGNIHIAWTDERNGNWEIYYTKLDNDGNTLVEDTRLTSEINESLYPSLALDYLGNVHIAWNDFRDGNWEVYYTQLNNNGNTIVDDKRLTYTIKATWYPMPSIAVDGLNNVHISWHSWGVENCELYYMKLDKNGNVLVSDKRLTNAIDDSRSSDLGIDKLGNVHITWEDRRNGYWEIYYTKLDNGGNTIINDKRLTFDNSIVRNPSLGVDGGGNVHIAWSDFREGNPRIYYTKLDNNGANLLDDTKLSSNSAVAASLGIDGLGNVHIAWLGNGIYYTKLNNNGVTLVDDTGFNFSGYPALGIDGSGNIHIAWNDGRHGGKEIYYMKGTTVDCLYNECDLFAEQVNTLVPPDGTYRNHGDYVSQVAHIIDQYLEAGLITEECASVIMKSTAQSDIGKKEKGE